MASAMLFRRAGGTLSLTKLNMVTFTFYIMIGTMFLGSTAVLLGVAITGHLEMLRDDRVLLLGWAAVMYAMIAVPVGMLLVAPFRTRSSLPKLIEGYRRRPVAPVFGRGDHYMKAVLKSATLVSAMALLYVFWTLPEIPLFNGFRGESDASVLALQRPLPADAVLPNLARSA